MRSASLTAAPSEMSRSHCEKGAWVAGDWVPIEECADKFSIEGGSHLRSQCARCPRKRSRTEGSAAKPDGSYDVVIIGAGCIGSAIARELSKSTASVLLLEAADDVTQGATKGNSGIVHSGYDDKPGTVRAKFCWPGNQMFPELDRQLHFGYERNGSLVLARNPDEEAILQTLIQKGLQNGVKGLKILNREQTLEQEPHVHPSTTASLYAPHAGIVMPYEYTIALAENAADNGVEVRIRREVTAIKKTPDGSFEVTARHWEPENYLKGQKRAGMTKTLLAFAGFCVFVGQAVATGAYMGMLPELLQPGGHALATLGGLLLIAGGAICTPAFAPKRPVVGKSDQSGKTVPDMAANSVGGSGSMSGTGGSTVEHESIRCRFVVNCGGTGADRIAAMIGDKSFKILPRLGDYILLRREQGRLAKATIFPTPHPVKGKGVLVQHTLWGNLILGPTARDTSDPATERETVEDVFRYILRKCKELVPGFDAKQSIHSFAGARAKSDRGDWIIGPSEMDRCFFNVAGIDSPGLAGSPAIAVEVTRLLKEAGLQLTPDPDFEPNRAPIVTVKSGWTGLKLDKSGRNPDPDPRKNVVCKCERVTEHEIVEACRRSLPVDSTQSIRRRTRAGMGHCQAEPGNYDCERRVAEIVARELGVDPSQVGRRPWPATSLFPQRWLTDQQKADLADIAER